MKKTDPNYAAYLQILREELIPACGCTEPIAIAYTAAKAREALGRMPEKLEVWASGNLLKNAKGVSIPNGGDLRGVDAAAVLGAVGGDASRELEVLESLPEGAAAASRKLLEEGFCRVRLLEGGEALHLVVEALGGGHSAKVELKNAHTHIVRIEKDGQTVYEADDAGKDEDGFTDRSCLTVRDIVDFADTCDLEDVRPLLQAQADCNLRIAEEGLKHAWGVNVGKLYHKNGKYLQSYAAAASDARMGGCNMPVVIVSGSGNQGATASLPVIQYAREIGADEDRMFRALALSDLLAIHLKSGIGRLSAYCGVVCAATGSGCAMTYLDGGSVEQIEETLTNSLATSSGIVCDGAKPSCAAKIATSLEGAIMAHQLAMESRGFRPGEGIVMDSVEGTIQAVGHVASKGMQETDQVILDLMTREE